MAAYDYRCETDGVFELTLPLGTAPATVPVPGVRRGIPAHLLGAAHDPHHARQERAGRHDADTGPAGRPAAGWAAADDRPDAGYAEALTDATLGALTGRSTAEGGGVWEVGAAGLEPATQGL